MKEEVLEDLPPESGRPRHDLLTWGKPLRDFLEAERSPAELMDWMRDLMPELDSPLAGYMVAQHELESELPAKETPLAVEPHQLLPVRAQLVPRFFVGKDDKLVSWVVTMVEVLNYHSGMGRNRLGPPELTAAQELMLTRLYGAVQRFEEKGGKVETFAKCRQEIGAVRFDYSGEPIQYMEELEAEKIIPCWPRPGEAGVQDARDFVPPEVQAWLDDPVMSLLPRTAWPDKPPPSRVRATDEQWEMIVKAGVERGMSEGCQACDGLPMGVQSNQD